MSRSNLTSLQKTQSDKPKSITKSILRVIIILCVGYVFCNILLYIFQDNLIFYRQSISNETLNLIKSANKNVEEISLKVKDGTRLRGWFVDNSRNQKSGLIIYFGGNAEEVSDMIDKVKMYEGWSTVLINYRGYGRSEGSPGEKDLYSDALEIYDYFLSKSNVDSSRIVIMGRSIGTGVATYLVQNRKAKGVILVSPYDNLTSVAQEHFPFVPVSLILKHKFDSIGRAPSINVPLGVIVASEDKTIPKWHSIRLVKEWKGKVTIKEIKGEDHNSLSDRDEYWRYIGEFLNGFIK